LTPTPVQEVSVKSPKSQPEASQGENTMLSKLRAAMTVKRAMFEMDDFIKMGQVRTIVNEALNSLIDRIGKSDQLAKANKTANENNETKINSLMQQMIGMQKLKNNFNLLFKQ
jgi:hypothetical protein